MICITEIRTRRFGSLSGVSHIVGGTSYKDQSVGGYISFLFYFLYSEIKPSSCLPSFQCSMSGKSCGSTTHSCRGTWACSRDSEDKARSNGSPGAV